MRNKLWQTVRPPSLKPADYAGLSEHKKLFGSALRRFRRIDRTPQLETSVQAVDIAEALADQIGGCALAGIAVIANHHERRIEIGMGDEVMPVSDCPGAGSL